MFEIVPSVSVHVMKIFVSGMSCLNLYVQITSSVYYSNDGRSHTSSFLRELFCWVSGRSILSSRIALDRVRSRVQILA
jgi:hypothetical protein